MNDRSLAELDRLLTGLSTEAAARMKRRGSRRRWIRGAGALAAAAVVAGIALALPETPSPERPRDEGLNVSSSRPFAVIPTSREDITIIWLMDSE